jgi:predicted HicB family RNase H-like nuclease
MRAAEQTSSETGSSKGIMVRLSTEDHTAIRVLAARLGVSMGAYVRRLVLADLKRRRKG